MSVMTHIGMNAPREMVTSRHAGAGQRQGDGERLNHAQQHRDVTRPLRDLAPAQFAFLLQLGQRLIDNREQLEDDRRRDVGHDAQREDRKPAKIAPGEQIAQAEQRTGVQIEVLRQRIRIDARRGNERPQTIHRQQAKREEDSLAEIGNTKDVGKFL